MKIEELEGERSRLEEDKRRLEAQLEHLTLQVGTRSFCRPWFPHPRVRLAARGLRPRAQGQILPRAACPALLGPAPYVCICVASWCARVPVGGQPGRGVFCVGWVCPSPSSHRSREVELLFSLFSFAVCVYLLFKRFRGREPAGL